MKSLFHYTINTGHGRNSPRDEVADNIIEILRPIVLAGGGNIPGTEFSLKLTKGRHGTMFDIDYSDVPIVTCGLAFTRKGVSEIWPVMVELVKTIRDAIARKIGISPKEAKHLLPLPSVVPQALPLLAVFLQPIAGFLVGLSVLAMAGDLERCVAWTILDQQDTNKDIPQADFIKTDDA
jgi:hypothetical protein